VFDSFDALLDALRAVGAEVREGGAVTQDHTWLFPSAIGRALILNGEPSQIFEFPDREAAVAGMAKLHARPNEVRPVGIRIAWHAFGQYFRSGRFVLYYAIPNDGRREDTTAQLLVALFGPPEVWLGRPWDDLGREDA
jgi:hypothetical protein